MSSLAALLVVSLLLCLTCGSIFTEATDGDPVVCSARWCGGHNISHPFRLQDSPNNCGDHRFILSCEEDDQLVLYWKSGKFRVQSINYNNYTIRLTDANHNYSSLHFPTYSLTSYNFSYHDAYQYWFRQLDRDYFILVKQILYMRCPYDHHQDSSNNATAATCIINGSANNFYVTDFEESLWHFGLGDSCRIEWMYPTSWPAAENNFHNDNFSCKDIHNMLLYGFELSWAISSCKNNNWHSVMLDDHNKVTCDVYTFWQQFLFFCGNSNVYTC